MLRLALAVPLCLSLVACQSGASPTNPTSTPAAGDTRIIALEGDLDFGDIEVRTIAEKTIRIVCGAVSVSWTGGAIAPSQWQDVIVRFNTAHGDSVNGMFTVNANATSGTNAMPISARSVSRR